MTIGQPDDEDLTNGQLLGEGQPIPQDRERWVQARHRAGLPPLVAITPFEAKALYAVEMIRHLAQGAMRCLGPPRADASERLELPAYVLLADAIEALGRCLSGDWHTNGAEGRLRTGLDDLLDGDGDFSGSGGDRRSVETCINLRNFALHGALALHEERLPHSRGGLTLDGELTRGLLDRLGQRLTAYWRDLGNGAQHQARRTALANARVLPMLADDASAPRTIFIANMYRLIEDGNAAGNGIHRPDAFDNSSQAATSVPSG